MSTKSQIIAEVQKQTAMNNARQLFTGINKNCFEKCVPKPGGTLSSSETQCMSACVEKYMATWNTVSQVYVQRLQQEQQQRSDLGGLSELD